MNDDDITFDIVVNCGEVQRNGDGYCNQDNNKEECGASITLEGFISRWPGFVLDENYVHDRGDKAWSGHKPAKVPNK